MEVGIEQSTVGHEHVADVRESGGGVKAHPFGQRIGHLAFVDVEQNRWPGHQGAEVGKGHQVGGDNTVVAVEVERASVGV